MEPYKPFRQPIVAEPSQHMDETHQLVSEIQKAMFNLSFELMKLPLFKNLNTLKKKFHQLLSAYDDFKQRFEQLKQIDVSKLSSEQRNIQRSYIIQDNMLEYSANAFDPYYNLSPVLDSQDIEQFEDLLISRSVFYEYMQFQLSQMQTLIATSENEKFNRFKLSLNQYNETFQVEAISQVLNEKHIGISKVCGALEEFQNELKKEIMMENTMQRQNLPPSKPNEQKQESLKIQDSKLTYEQKQLLGFKGIKELEKRIQRANYQLHVEFMEKQSLKDSMIVLMEMGFMDCDKNEKLLVKHKGNMQLVINDLALGL